MSKNLVKTAALMAATTLAVASCGNDAAAGGDAGFEPQGKTTMTIPFSAGGGSDLAGRAVAGGLEDATGLTITPENKVGGSGAVGYSHFMAQKGSGNQLLATETSLVTLPLTQNVEFAYDSFTPIMKIGDDYAVVVAAADSPYNTCKELTDAGQDKRVIVAVSGKAGPDEIIFSLFEEETGASFDRVPFESGSEVMTALLGGRVDAASLNPGEVAGQLASGDVKPLCTSAEERYEYEDFADIETAKEQGIDASFSQFRGIIAPAGISDEAKKYWIDAAKEFEGSEAYTSYVEENLLQPTVAYGPDFQTYLDEYHENVQRVLKD